MSVSKVTSVRKMYVVTTIEVVMAIIIETEKVYQILDMVVIIILFLEVVLIGAGDNFGRENNFNQNKF